MANIILPKGTKGKVKQYLINAIKCCEDDRFHEATIKEICRVAIKEKFSNENEKRYYKYNAKNAIKDWFKGLGMGVDCTYEDVENRMKLWGYTNNSDNYELYWDILAKVVYECN